MSFSTAQDLVTASRKHQELWLKEQPWYLALDHGEVFSDISPFLDIFIQIPTFWDKPFLVDLEDRQLISEDRLKTIQSGVPLTQTEINSIRETLVTDSLEGLDYDVAKRLFFDFHDDKLEAVFVGAWDPRVDWNNESPKFIGIFDSRADVNAAVSDFYSSCYVTNEHLE